MSIKTYKQATRDALAEEMNRDPSIYIIAEDLLSCGGGNGQYSGLVDMVDPSRLLDAPISETAIVSSAVGAALGGMRPIVDLRFSNCMPVCMDEIMNQAAKSRYMFGGQGKVHMVIRCPDGIMPQQGAHHTDCLEAWFAHIPGLQVVVPSNPEDGVGLLKTAIRNDNPVMFFEHKSLFAPTVIGEVPDEEYTIPLGKARISREGSDVTIVCYGILVGRALKAAEELAKEGISCEVIDLRTVSPWDKEAVLASVKKTGRVVIAHEAVKQGGFGGEIAATIAEDGFEYLKAPIQRLGAPFVPTPMTSALERLCYTTSEQIIEAVHKIVK